MLNSVKMFIFLLFTIALSITCFINCLLFNSCTSTEYFFIHERRCSLVVKFLETQVTVFPDLCDCVLRIFASSNCCWLLNGILLVEWLAGVGKKRGKLSRNHEARNTKNDEIYGAYTSASS